MKITVLASGDPCFFRLRFSLSLRHTCARYSPLVKTAVYDGVVHRRTHGKEEDREINLLNVLLLVDVFLEAPQDEVCMIGQPADSKNDHNYHHGLHKLGKQNQCVIPGPLGDRWGNGKRCFCSGSVLPS